LNFYEIFCYDEVTGKKNMAFVRAVKKIGLYYNKEKNRLLLIHSGLKKFFNPLDKNNCYLTGFTLIELVVTLVILLVLSTAVITNFTGADVLILDAAANKLVSDIRYVQQLAITKHSNFGISFDPNDESYYAYKELPTPFNKISNPLTHENLEIDYSDDEELKRVNLVSTNLTNNIIEFNSIGRPFDGSGTGINYVGEVNLSYTDFSRTIKIEKNTGKVWIE